MISVSTELSELQKQKLHESSLKYKEFLSMFELSPFTEELFVSLMLFNMNCLKQDLTKKSH